MRLALVLDAVYRLGFAAGEVTGSPVCPSVPRGAYEAVRPPRPMASAGVTAFIDVNIVPMDTERVLANQTVLIEDGRITALGQVRSVPVPAGAVRIDGRGKYLMPGLADMHAHFAGSYDQMEHRLFSYLANGITTVRNLTIAPIVDEHVRRLFTTAEISRPRMYMSPFYAGDRQWYRYDDPATISPVPLDSMAAYVAAAKAAGFNFIYMPETYIQAESPKDRQARDSLLAIARQLNLPVGAHSHKVTGATRWASLEEILALGVNGGSYEHVHALRELLLGEGKAEPSASDLRKLATAIQRAGVWITVTSICAEMNYRLYTEANKKRNENLSLEQHRERMIKVLQPFTKALQDAGVGLLLGIDGDGGPYGPHVGANQVHNELAAVVRAGLSPYQALLTGTRNVAQYLGQLDSSGTVAVGKRADLVLLSGNPLVDIRHTREPAGVMMDGRWFDRAALDQGLLAFQKYWFGMLVMSSVHPHLFYTLSRGEIKSLRAKFWDLNDSLAFAKPGEHKSLLQRLVNELAAFRAILTPEQRESFDPMVRVWLRERVRRDNPVAIPGVVLTP